MSGPLQTSPRKPWLAGLLSLLVVGLGHLYIGRGKKGLILYGLFVISVLAYYMLAMSGSISSPFNVLSGVLLILFVYVVAIVSSVFDARRLGEAYQPKNYNRWYVYVGAWIIVSLCIGPLIKVFIAQSYKFPSKLMTPTILPGDHVLVSKLAYGVQWPADCQIRFSLTPIACYTSNTLISFHPPSRGDLIIFRYPEDEDKDFLKRIIGLPGDNIEIRDKVVSVNGKPLNDSHYTQRIDPGIIDRSVNARDNFGPITVPDQSYFVLGDNRDQSLDSGFFGYVRADKIKGKAKTIYWSEDLERIGHTLQ